MQSVSCSVKTHLRRSGSLQISIKLEAALYETKEQLVRCAGLEGLGRIAATNKANRSIIHAYVRFNCGWLLDHVLAQTCDAQQKQPMGWIASVARNYPKAALIVAEKLLSIRSVSPELAAELVRAGVRVAYAPLLAAAKRGVPGVEVWVRAAVAQQQEGGTTDIPPLAVVICCDGDWVCISTGKLIAMAMMVLRHLVCTIQVPMISPQCSCLPLAVTWGTRALHVCLPLAGALQ
jgi:hypothetical protein